MADLEKVLPFAWPLPRFEANDFAAAIVRAWKEEGGGNIYIDGSPKGWEQIHFDTEWVYVIQPTKNRQKNSFPGFLGEPEVAVYDWQNYWFAEADPEQTQPRPLSRVRLLQAKETGLGWKGS